MQLQVLSNPESPFREAQELSCRALAYA